MGIRNSSKSQGRSTGRSKETDEARERLQVADTVEQLRRQMEDLIARLARAEQPDEGGHVETQSKTAASAGAPKDLDVQIEAVSRKVDQASDLLSEMTDLLEAQSGHIEMNFPYFVEKAAPVWRRLSFG